MFFGNYVGCGWEKAYKPDERLFWIVSTWFTYASISIDDYLLWLVFENDSAFGLKLVSAIFYQNFIFHQMIALQKLWKMFFISSKKLFSFLRYLDFCIFVFPS